MTIRRALLSVYDKTGLAAFARSSPGSVSSSLASSGSAKLLADERIPRDAARGADGLRRAARPPGRDAPPGRARRHPRAPRRAGGHGRASARTGSSRSTSSASTSTRSSARSAASTSPGRTRSSRSTSAAPRCSARRRRTTRTSSRSAVPRTTSRVVEEFRMRGEISDATRRRLAARAFQRTAAYDAAVAGWLGRDDSFPETFVPVFERYMDLPYGENPHQRARLLRAEGRADASPRAGRAAPGHGRSPSTTSATSRPPASWLSSWTGLRP